MVQKMLQERQMSKKKSQVDPSSVARSYSQYDEEYMQQSIKSNRYQNAGSEKYQQYDGMSPGQQRALQNNNTYHGGMPEAPPAEEFSNPEQLYDDNFKFDQISKAQGYQPSFLQLQAQDDPQYQDAVEFAKAQIQREMQRQNPDWHQQMENIQDLDSNLQDEAPEPQQLNIEKHRGRNTSKVSQKENYNSNQEVKYQQNPQYNHVQPKLYNATISHDIKSNMAKGKPPTNNKAQNMMYQADREFENNHTFQPAINNKFKSTKQRDVSRDERFKKL